jgi:hypothetical protein
VLFEQRGDVASSRVPVIESCWLLFLNGSRNLRKYTTAGLLLNKELGKCPKPGVFGFVDVYVRSLSYAFDIGAGGFSFVLFRVV